MALYMLYGEGYNQLTRMASAATPESAAAKYPIANLYDGIPNKPFIFGSAGGSGYIDFDLQQLTNGGFETWSGGAPTGWTVTLTDGGTVTEEAVIFNGGAKSAKLATAGGLSDAAQVSQIKYVPAGKSMSISAALYGTGAAPTIALKVTNLVTGNSLDQNGAWGVGQTVMSRSAASWATATVAFTVESYSDCGSRDLVPVQIVALVSTSLAVSAYVDDVVLFPTISFASLHGHNIKPACGAIEIRSGTSSPAATVRATFTHAQPTMFATFAAVAARYWRLFVTTDPATGSDPVLDAISIGELVLGEYATSTRNQNLGFETTLTDPQDRSASDIGPLQAFVRTTRGRRQLALQFRLLNTATDYAQWKEILERSRNGAFPLVVVVDSADSTSAIMCRVPPSWRVTRPLDAMRDHSLDLEEMPFPIVVA